MPSGGADSGFPSGRLLECDGIWHSSGRRGVGKLWSEGFCADFDQYSKASFDQAVSRLQEMPETVDGVIVGTLFKEAVIQLSEHLDAGEIPYVYVDSDIEEQGRLAYYGTDSVAGGEIGARMLLASMAFQGDILVAHIQHDKGSMSTQGRNAIPASCNT